MRPLNTLARFAFIKVVYGPSRTWYDMTTHETKMTAETSIDMHGLKKFTNYTMQVR